MAVIDRLGRLIAEHWSYPDDADPAGRPAILPLEALLAAAPENLPSPLGVLLPPGAAVEAIAALLDRLDLVAVEFPKFRDGRGFTLARRLRERYGYRGDIRAVGHFIPDQFAALAQCGFSSLRTPPEHPPEQWAHVSTPPQDRDQLLNRLVDRGVAVEVPSTR